MPYCPSDLKSAQTARKRALARCLARMSDYKPLSQEARLRLSLRVLRCHFSELLNNIGFQVTRMERFREAELHWFAQGRFAEAVLRKDESWSKLIAVRKKGSK